MASLFDELKQRNVIRVSIAYLASAWLFLQVADTVLPAFDAPAWVLRALIIVFALGLPIAIAVSWAYEITPDGVVRAEEVSPERSGDRKGRKLDFAIITILALALTAVVTDQYIIGSGSLPEYSTLAVLPLENLSGDPQQQYFTDGMTEALITNLANVNALRVTSRTSVMRFRDSDRSLPAIAAELGASLVVVGSAVRDGDKVRINVQLVDASSDEHLWAERYERSFDDVFVLQGDIAKAIATEVRVAISPEETSRLSRVAEQSVDGYDEYLKGMQHFYRLTVQDLETSLKYFDLALELNPDSALAHSGVAATWVGLQQMGFVPSGTASPNAEAAALRALELDSDLAEAHVWLGVIRAWVDWDWEEAEVLFKQAIHLNPSSGNARIPYSHLLALHGRFDEAKIQADEALRVDPYNGWFKGVYGVELHMEGRYDDATRALQDALRISPDLPFVWLVLAGSHHMSGRFDEAIEAEAALLVALGDKEGEQSFLKLYRESGYETAMTWLADRSAEYSKSAGALDWWTAFRYAHAGNKEETIRSLQQAYAHRDPNLPFFRVPEFDSVRSDPRVRELMRHVGVR